ncbi:MAG TPA: hypothetical protein PLJ78_11500 [Anaerolineae bacterium]|nr:hypothetical protein [Anaerolineae bacterium]HQK14554.1 hypothetical protein [Anaerolineae bacterium]
MKRLISPVLVVYLLVACSGPATPATPIPSDVAKSVLEKVAEEICYGHPQTSSFFYDETTYGLLCSPAGGHHTLITLEWFSNESDAQAAFDVQKKGRIVMEFHGASLLVWGEDHPSFPGGREEYRIWLWQMRQWLIGVRAFDDTHFISAPDPGKVSEAIYQVGLEYGLFTTNDQ